MLLACLLAWAAPARAQGHAIQVYGSSMEGNWVGVRASGAPAGSSWVKVADHTPVWLRFPLPGVAPAARYDIRVESRGWLLRYAAERTGVWPEYDTELRPFNLRWNGVNPLGAGAGVVLLVAPTLGAAWLRQRNRHLQERLARTERAKALLATSKGTVGPLPPLLGRELETGRGEMFEILRLIGRGSMGAVFEAVTRGPQRAPEEAWAVKVPFRDKLPTAGTRTRFTREVEICSRLSHPGLVHVLDWGTFDPGPEEGERRWPFFVMELVEGHTLRDELTAAHGKGLPWRRVARVLGEMASALKCLHAADVLHRDLKPDNVFVTPSRHVKIGDFGLAGRVDHHSLTMSQDALGTPMYMSPEHLQAHTMTPASDTFSLGVIAYELLCGQPPFAADTPFAVFTRILSDDPIPLERMQPDVPPWLAALVHRMLERDPQRRPSCGEIVDWLREGMTGVG